MKATIHLPSILIATAVLALTTCAYADDPKKHGTDVLHIATQTRMANAGVLSTASGKVELHWNKQGKANHQELSLKLKGLDAAATYQLGVFLNGDSNLTQVVTFTADHEGKADIHLREKGPKHSHPH